MLVEKMYNIPQKHIDLVEKSGFFDADWYREKYQDTVAMNLEPLVHFLWVGHRIGRSPSPKFCSQSYLAAYLDVKLAGLNPLIHYLENGILENRLIYPVRDEGEKKPLSFTLVAGLSSSGKSTWLAQNAKKEDIIFPFYNQKVLSEIPDSSLIHYNTLRYAENNEINLNREFMHDPFLKEILRYAGRFDLIYIAATSKELLRRIDVRNTIEDGEGVYPQDLMAAAIKKIDHRTFHIAWLDFLVPLSRRAQFILSDTQGFNDVSQSELIEAMSKI